MQKIADVVLDKSGNVVVGAAVYVKKQDGTLATLYSDNQGGALSNPLYTDSYGRFGFYATNGRYNIEVSIGGVVTNIQNDVLLDDPVDQDQAGVSDGGAMPIYDYAELRAYAGASTGARVTKDGLSGLFFVKSGDSTTPDNGCTVIVDAAGRRWHRLYDGPDIQAAWAGVVGGPGIDESNNIVIACNALGNRGGTVIVRALNPDNYVYINSPIQIEYHNLTLRFMSPLAYGAAGWIRINGGLGEVIRTDLGQTNILKLRANSTTDAEGRMILPLQVGGGAYIQVGDRLIVRGENDAWGKAYNKQQTTVIAIVDDDVTCADEPDQTYQTTYPGSAWPPDLTTGTTVAIAAYSAATIDYARGNVVLPVVSTTYFNVGDLVYISDARTEADMMAPVVTNLRSACNMEIARVIKKDAIANTLTIDRPLCRDFPVAWEAGVTKIDAIRNSHMVLDNDSYWVEAQPDRKKNALAINYGDGCTIRINAPMDGKAGRIGAAGRIAYSYDSHAVGCKVYDAYRFESAEGYGLTLYYSTLCTIVNSKSVGGRHNYLIQTGTLCNIDNNYSGDDYISGIDLHGANSYDCKVRYNLVTRSNNYSPGVTKGGAIRNGNTSHTLGDHYTIIEDNHITGYVGTDSAGADVSPSSRDVVIHDNDFTDSAIGVRHYKVNSSITPAQHSNRLTITNNTFRRITQKIFDIENYDGNSYWDELYCMGNTAHECAIPMIIKDIPRVVFHYNNQLDPVYTVGVHAFELTNIADLETTGNYADRTDLGMRVQTCPGARLVKNNLGNTVAATPITDGGGNTGWIVTENTDSAPAVVVVTTSDIADFREAVEDRIAATLLAGAGLSITYDDPTGKVTITNTGNTSTSDQITDFQEAVEDRIGLSLLAGSGIAISYDDGTGKTTIGATASLPPLNGLLVPIGDSRSAQWFSYTNTVPALLTRSPGYWAEALSRRCRIDGKYRQGVSGDEVEQIYARITGNTLNDAGYGPNNVPTGTVWVFLAGTNNATGATSKAYMDGVLAVHQQCVDWMLARGDRAIVVTEWPRGPDGSGTLTANEKKMFMYYVEALRRQYRGQATRVRILDVWPAAADPSTGDPITNLLNPDKLHNSPGIAYLMGKGIAAILEEWGMQIQYCPTASNADAYDATYDPKGNIHPNPRLLGTAGTVSTNATGTAPDSWTLDASEAGISVAGSRETITLPDGRVVDACKLVVSGTATATGAYARLRRSSLLASVAAADILEGGCEVLVAAGHQNLNGIGMVIDPGVTVDQVHGGLNLGGTNADNVLPASLVEQMYLCPRTPQYTVPGTLPASLAFDIRVRFTAAAACSATVWIISSSLRKANA